MIVFFNQTEPMYVEAMESAQAFLESQIEVMKDNSYTMAITYNALKMTESLLVNRLKELLLAKVTEEGEG